MNDVLALCSGLPEVRVAMGDTLIEEAVRADRLYVLKDGAFEVVRNDVRVTVVNEPGAFLGEISAVLGSAPTASVVAARDSIVYVIHDASASVRARPDLTFAIAQLLARRLTAQVKAHVWGRDVHLEVPLCLLQQGLGAASGLRHQGAQGRGVEL